MPIRQPKHKALSATISLDRINKSSHTLSQLLGKAEQLQGLSELCYEYIPKQFRNKILINGIEGKTLVLTSQSASVATRLRVNQQDLINRLNQHPQIPRINTLSIKIRPAQYQRRTTQNTKTLSKENAQLLLEEAGQTKDESLRKILTRLAGRA